MELWEVGPDVAIFDSAASSIGVCSISLTVHLDPPHTMADVTQTDVSRPSALPSARLRPSASQPQSVVDQSSAEYLDFIEEEWNKKVDVEVDTLVDGMVEIVNLASVCDTTIYDPRFLIALNRLETRTSSKSHKRHLKPNVVPSRWSGPLSLYYPSPIP